jgi:hypothetical protein
MSQYFIKRGSKTQGPFPAEKVDQLIKAKKLKPSDEVSLSEEGPWDRLPDVHEEIRNGTYALSTPVATQEKVLPNVITCPDCGGKVSKRASSCPHCGGPCGAIEDDDFSSPLVSEGYDTDYDAPPQRRKKTSKRRQLNAGNSRDDVNSDFSYLPSYYRKEFQKIHESDEAYKGKFNLMAFLLGPIWAIMRGLWLSVLVCVILSIVTAGIAGVVYWIIWGVRGNYMYYRRKVRHEQTVY